jgi:hypothetical protein
MSPPNFVFSNSMPTFSFLRTALQIATFSSASVLVAAADAGPTLLSRNGVEVSFADAYAYSLRVTNPDAYASALSRPGAVHTVLENLYIFGRALELAEKEGLITAEEQNYLASDAHRRAALERYLERSLNERSSEIDWEGLAELEYAKQRSSLKSDEEVRVKHLLISISDTSFDSFVVKVREVQSQLDDDHDFDALIKQYSDDPSVDVNGGDLGFFKRQRMQPSFSEAAFSLKEPGDLVGPVMTMFGAHFIKLIDRREERTLTFEEVRNTLLKEVEKATLARVREELLSELRSEIESDILALDQASIRDLLIETFNSRSSASVEH